MAILLAVAAHVLLHGVLPMPRVGRRILLIAGVAGSAGLGAGRSHPIHVPRPKEATGITMPEGFCATVFADRVGKVVYARPR